MNHRPRKSRHEKLETVVEAARARLETFRRQHQSVERRTVKHNRVGIAGKCCGLILCPKPWYGSHEISHFSSSSSLGAASPVCSSQKISMRSGIVRLFSHAFMEFLTKSISCTCNENCEHAQERQRERERTNVYRGEMGVLVDCTRRRQAPILRRYRR